MTRFQCRPLPTLRLHPTPRFPLPSNPHPGSHHLSIPHPGSHDRSIRRWERTQEPFFVEEEREKRLDSMFEADMERATADGQQEQEAAAKEAAEGGVAPAGVCE